MYSVSIHRNKLRYKNFIAKHICSFFPNNSHSNEFCILSHIINENPTSPNVFKHNWYCKLSPHIELLFMALVLINFVMVLLLLLVIRNNEQYLFIYLFIIFVAAFVYLDKVILHRGSQLLLIVLFCYKKNLTIKYCMPFMKITFQIDWLINFLGSMYRLKIKVVW